MDGYQREDSEGSYKHTELHGDLFRDNRSRQSVKHHIISFLKQM
jgi:hypothetical protein